MLLNSLRLAGLCILIVGCSQPTRILNQHNEVPNESLLPKIRDYCWGSDRFIKIDLDRAAFIQFVNNDMVIYRISGDEEFLYCAYPVDNKILKPLVKLKNIPHSEYWAVTP